MTVGAAMAMLTASAQDSQTYEGRYERSLHEVLTGVEKQFGIRLKMDAGVDTVDKRLPYADFRIRAYSVEETLVNVLAPFDYVPWAPAKGNTWKIKKYDYPRRKEPDGVKLAAWLSTLYNNKEQWETRRDTLRSEVRQRLGIDPLLAQCTDEAPDMGKLRKHDGYTVQNFCLKTVNGHTVKGSIYAPQGKGKHPLIICPNGHFLNGRYGRVQQERLGTLARMGAICVSYDIWGWGESEDEVGKEAHHTSEAHVMQALNGLRILDFMMKRKDVDATRVAANGGSGGGTAAVLLTALDDRFTASCPVVSICTWFDGGCPCESGMPIQLSAGGTCNPEIAAMIAPRPMMIVSDSGDWTHTTPEVEYPFIKRIYGFYGAEDKVRNIHLEGERHDFGPNKRQAVYRFFIDTFGLDESKLDESKITIEEESVLRFGK